MVQVKSALEVRRTLVPWGFKSIYSADIPLGPGEISLAADRLLTLLERRSLLTGRELKNVKGGLDLPAASFHREELLLVEGEAPASASHFAPFKVRLLTTFKEFKGADIFYNSETSKDGPLPPFVNLTNVARLFPLRLSHLQISIDFFGPTFVSALFGNTPGVLHSAQLQCGKSALGIRLISARVKDRYNPPDFPMSLLADLDALLSKTFSFGLIEDYRRRLR